MVTKEDVAEIVERAFKLLVDNDYETKKGYIITDYYQDSFNPCLIIVEFSDYNKFEILINVKT